MRSPGATGAGAGATWGLAARGAARRFGAGRFAALRAGFLTRGAGFLGAGVLRAAGRLAATLRRLGLAFALILRLTAISASLRPVSRGPRAYSAPFAPRCAR